MRVFLTIVPWHFGTGTHLGTEKYKEISPSQFGSKDVVGVVGPNNVISLLTLEPGNDYITPTSV